MQEGDTEALLRTAEAREAAARGFDLESYLTASLALGAALRRSGRVREAVACMRGVGVEAHRHVLPQVAVDAGFWLAQSLEYAGDLMEAGQVVREASELAARAGDFPRARHRIARRAASHSSEVGHATPSGGSSTRRRRSRTSTSGSPSTRILRSDTPASRGRVPRRACWSSSQRGAHARRRSAVRGAPRSCSSCRPRRSPAWASARRRDARSRAGRVWARAPPSWTTSCGCTRARSRRGTRPPALQGSTSLSPPPTGRRMASSRSGFGLAQRREVLHGLPAGADVHEPAKVATLVEDEVGDGQGPKRLSHRRRLELEPPRPPASAAGMDGRSTTAMSLACGSRVYLGDRLPDLERSVAVASEVNAADDINRGYANLSATTFQLGELTRSFEWILGSIEVQSRRPSPMGTRRSRSPPRRRTSASDAPDGGVSPGACPQRRGGRAARRAISSWRPDRRCRPALR